MNRIQKTYRIAFLFVLLLGCEALLFEEDLGTFDPQENLDYLWNQANEKYSYFELKGIDWDQVYDEYSAKISTKISGDSLFRVLGAMLTELEDDHTNLISNFNISFFGTRNLGPDNFDWRIITDNYLPSDYYVSGPFSHDFLKNTNQKIGYVRFSSFTGTVSGSNIGFILSRYRDTEGLILDLRENGGGSVSDVFNILSRFVDEKTLLLYSRAKNGADHNDFGKAEPAYVDPSPGTRYLKPVMVLVDRGTYSAGSFTSLAIKALPNLVLIGDTTGGGLGLPNGGQLPNGWRYRFSVSQALDLNLNNEFEMGVPPDILSFVNWDDRTKDEVIERAVFEILGE